MAARACSWPASRYCRSFIWASWPDRFSARTSGYSIRVASADAGTEGLLIAMGSSLVAPGLRTSGLALVGTAIGLGKMGSSVLFGAIWDSAGSDAAVLTFCLAMIAVLLFSARRLRGLSTGTTHV